MRYVKNKNPPKSVKFFSYFKQIKEVKGLFWGSAAISNAKWTGVKLVDVLKYCKLNFNDKSIKHVQFEGLDITATGDSYGASCPAETVRLLS